MTYRLHGLSAEPLSVALREPFVIATATMDETRAVLVRVDVLDTRTGRQAEGLGEAAPMPPVTAEDRPEVLAALDEIAGTLVGAPIDALAPPVFPDRPVAEMGLRCALLDAVARLSDAPLYRWLAPDAVPVPLRTDITIPIGEPSHMAELARAHHAAGFDCFKVKVGKDLAHDRAALRAIRDDVPEARFRLDANEGFAAPDALRLLDELLSGGAVVELFEQPCPRDDLAGMAAVTAASPVPVIADESVRDLHDLARVLDAGAAHGVNLKLAKMGGPLGALAVGRAARTAGLSLMAGAMVETRLGLTAMAHVVTALGGVDWLDLDTAFLLAGDPFEGGYDATGPNLALREGPGLSITAQPKPTT